MKKRSNVPLPIVGFQGDIVEREFSSLNVVSDQAGWVGIRPALSTLAAAPLGSTGVFGMASFDNKLVRHTGSAVYSESTLLLSTGLNTTFGDFAELNDLLFFVPAGLNATYPVQVYDKATVRETTAMTSATTKLVAATICSHRGILWSGYTLEDDGEHPNRLRWSAFAEPENYTPWGTGNYQNYEDIGKISDPIIRLVSFKNNLIIFKERSVWVAGGIDGVNVGPEEIIQVSADNGIVGPNAVAVTDSAVYMIAEDGVKVSYDGINWKDAFPEIMPMIEQRKREYWQYSIISVNQVTETIYVGVPIYGPYCEDLFVRCPDGNWWRHTYPYKITCLATTFSSANTILTYMGDETGATYYVDPGNTLDFGTTAITSKYGMDWISGGTSKTKLLRSLQFIARVEGIFNVTVNLYIDGDLTPVYTKVVSLQQIQPTLDVMQLDIQTTAQKNIHVPHFVDLTNPAKIFRLEFTSTSKFKMRDLIVGMVPRGGI